MNSLVFSKYLTSIVAPRTPPGMSRTCNKAGLVVTGCSGRFSLFAHKRSMTCMLGKAEGVPEGVPSCKIVAPSSAFDYVFVVLHRRAVDFGAGWWAPKSAFGQQKALNAPGKSPPFCSEF